VPYGDRFCSIEISVKLKTVIAAMEVRLISANSDMQTAGAHLGSVAWINQDDLGTGTFCLVDDHRLQFCETPPVNYLRFPVFANSRDVFQHDPQIGGLRLSDNMLADAMVGVGNEPPLSARDTHQRAFCAFAAVELKMFPQSSDRPRDELHICGAGPAESEVQRLYCRRG
jgi:hypothetical protein